MNGLIKKEKNTEELRRYVVVGCEYVADDLRTKDIRAMVRELITPPNRTILFLQQSMYL